MRLSFSRFKGLLLIFGIAFILYGIFILPPNESNDFRINLLAAVAEILIGTFIVIAVVDEIIKRDKREKLSLILFMENGRVALFTFFIVTSVLSKFALARPESDKSIQMAERLNSLRIGMTDVLANADTLASMKYNFLLWQKLFFDEGTINPKKDYDYSETITQILSEIKSAMNHLKKINARLERVADTKEQLEAIYAFEIASETIETDIYGLSNGRHEALMIALHSLLGSCLFLYSMSLQYRESLDRKREWWLERFSDYFIGS
ncbi:hypothetical protein [Methanothrix sp.]|jgi:hypothetical protein|uniref:hypothetical protein n=1 Tax=Methanothrix sp. TaxID=90426 RepID=UPI0025D41349|nr:hypothetical protein [Methanothrix sp.]